MMRRARTMYQRFKWWINGIIILFVLLFALFCSYHLYLTYLYRSYVNHSVLPNVINTVLQIPYYKEHGLRNDYPDIVKLNKEDWLKLKCTPLRYASGEVFKSVRGIKDDVLSDEDALQLRCLGIMQGAPEKPKSSKTINGELCSNVFNCRLIHLGVDKYVLDNPEILWSILKVAERPCDYVQEAAKPSYAVQKAEYYESRVGYDTYKSFRMNLRCDGRKYPWYALHLKEKVYVLITVRDMNNKRWARFIVRRKDVD